jgi:hypothetical protein
VRWHPLLPNKLLLLLLLLLLHEPVRHCLLPALSH